MFLEFNLYFLRNTLEKITGAATTISTYSPEKPRKSTTLDYNQTQPRTNRFRSPINSSWFSLKYAPLVIHRNECQFSSQCSQYNRLDLSPTKCQCSILFDS